MKALVLPYSHDWPGAFEREKSALTEKFCPWLTGIHHIGSTSVPGLSAKPIIDILLEVTSLDVLDEQSKTFSSLGYEVKGEYGIAGRRYFRKGVDKRTHHIHAYQQGTAHVMRHLAFRDYLRSHPEVRQAYQSLKQRLVSDPDLTGADYAAGKSPFLELHEARAIQWQLSRSKGVG